MRGSNQSLIPSQLNIQGVQTSDNLNALDPESMLEAQNLNRRQQIANLLMQHGMQPIQGQQAGRFYVAPSWAQGLNQLAQAGLGAWLTKDIGEQQQQLGQRNQQAMAQAVQGFADKINQPPTPQVVPGDMQPVNFDYNNNAKQIAQLKDITAAEAAKGEPHAQGQLRTMDMFQGPTPQPTYEPGPAQGVPQSPVQTALEKVRRAQNAYLEAMAKNPRMAAFLRPIVQQAESEATLAMKQEELAQGERHFTTQQQNEMTRHNMPSGTALAEIKGREHLSDLNPDIVKAKENIAAAGRSQTITNVNSYVPGNVELQKDMAKGLVANYDRLQDVPVQIQNLNQARDLIGKSSPFVGSFGDQKLAIVQFFNNNLGTNINPQEVANAGELRTRIFQNIMDNLKKLDAQPSQLQQKIMMDALGNLNTDPKAMNQMLTAYEDVLRGKVEQHNHRVDQMPADMKPLYDIHVKVPPRAASSGAPAIGHVEDGYRFKGGNPGDPNSWEKVK